MQKTDDFFPFKTTSLSPDTINIPLYPGSKRYVPALSSEYAVSRLNGAIMDRIMKELKEKPIDVLKELSSLCADGFPDANNSAGVRTKRYLQKLRENGFCKEDKLSSVIERLCNMSQLKGDFYNTWICSVAKVDRQQTSYKWDKKTVDVIWSFAIEKNILYKQDRREKKDILSDAEYYAYVERNIADVYWAAADAMVSLLMVLSFEQAAGLRSEIKTGKKALAQAGKVVQAARMAAQTVAEENTSLKRSQALKENELRETEKRVSELTKENRSLLETIRDLERKNELLTHILSSPDPGEQEDEDEPEKENQETDLSAKKELENYENIVLPEDSSVLFLGGVENFINKMKLIHPNWRYVSTHIRAGMDVAKTAGSRISCVFFFYKHISHSISWSILENLGPEIPVIYVDAQNLNRAELAMKKGWKDYLESRNKLENNIEKD